jgi:integrase
MTKKADTRSRGQIERRGDSKFLVRVYLGRVDGKRKYSSRVTEGTYRMAEQELTKMLREIDTQSFVEPAKMTVKEYLTQWLEGRVDVKPRTLRGYREQVQYNILPHLAAYRVDQLSKLVIEKAWKALIDLGKSPGSVVLAHRVLSPALRALVDEGKLVRNPCDLVTLPRNPKREQKVLSPEQVVSFLEKNSAHELYALWMLLMTTGLRPSEALGLQWADLNTDDGTISIKRAVTEDREGTLMVDETKTDLSARMVSIPSTTSRGTEGSPQAPGSGDAEGREGLRPDAELGLRESRRAPVGPDGDPQEIQGVPEGRWVVRRHHAVRRHAAHPRDDAPCR